MSELNVGVPQELEQLICRRLEEQKDAELRRIKARETEARRQAEIDRLRAERFDELWEAAEFIFAWRRWLAGSDVCDGLFRAFGDRTRLVLYRGGFWRGEPKKKDDRAANARLLLNGNPRAGHDEAHFIYEEYRNSSHGSSTPNAAYFYTPAQLISGVHPEFLLEAYASLRSPSAWKFALQELGLKPPR